MEHQKQAKQAYLVQNIINAGYEGEDFAQYCEKVCGNVDIDNWSMDELKDIVKAYASSKKSIETAIHQTSFIDYQQDDEKPNFSTQNLQNQNIQKSYELSQQKSFGFPTQMKKINSSNKSSNKFYQNDKDNLDKLFQDPFKNNFKKKSKQSISNDWGYDSQPPSYPTELWKDKTKDDQFDQFNFDRWTPKVEKKKSVTHVQVETNYLSASTSRNNVGNTQASINYSQTNSQFHSQPSNTKKQSKQPNMSIFDINFDDIKDVQLPSKKGTKTETKSNLNKDENHQTNVSIQNNTQNTAQIPVNLDLFNSVNPSNPSVNQGAPTQRKKVKNQGQRIVQQDWSDRVKCIKAKTRHFSTKPDLEVVISGHQVVKRNLFMPDYVRYFVKTEGINAQVKRKYNQFQKLRSNLQKFYPGFKLPYLAKAGWIQQSDPSNIATQKALIGNFMNDLLMNRQLRNCRIVEEFLTIVDYKALKSKFQEYDKMARLHSIEQLCLLPGEVEVGYSEAHRVYLEKLPAFVQNMEILLDRYKKQIQHFVGLQQMLQKCMQDLAETTSTLQSLTKTYNSSIQIGQCYELEATLRLIRKIYKEVNKHSKFQMSLFDTELKPLIKYERDNLSTIKQQLEYKARFNESFNPNLKVEKKEQYTNTNLDQYKQKIDQPSRSITVLKYQHGYFANQAVMEGKRMLTNFSKKLSSKFSNYCHLAEQRSIEATSYWAEMKKSMILPMMA